MTQNISQILQKAENLLFRVNISFSWLNFNNCIFPLQFWDEMVVYQFAQLCYKCKRRPLKLYPGNATVTTRPCYFLPHSLWSRQKRNWFNAVLSELELVEYQTHIPGFWFSIPVSRGLKMNVPWTRRFQLLADPAANEKRFRAKWKSLYVSIFPFYLMIRSP